MKKKIALILAVIMLVSLFASAVSAATLPAGKEFGATVFSWDVPEFGFSGTVFTVSPAGAWNGGERPMSYDGTVSRGANGSIHFEDDGDATGNHYMQFWTGGGKLQKNKTYLMSVYVKSATAGKNVCIRVDSNGSGLIDQWYTTTSTDWEEVSMLVTLENDPPSDGYQGIVFAPADQGEFWIDDITFTEVVNSSNNLLSLPGNEDGGFVELNDTGDGYAAFYRPAPVEAGKTYVLTAKAMTNNVDVKLAFDAEVPAFAAYWHQFAGAEAWEDITYEFTAVDAGTNVRFYTIASAQMLVKDVKIVEKDTENVVLDFDAKSVPTDVQSTYGADKTFHGYIAPAPEKTNLFTLEEVTSEDYLALQPTESNGYAAYYMRAKMKKDTEYTITFDMISNTTDISAMVDLEGLGGIGSEKAVENSVVDKWEKMTVKIKPTQSYSESSNKDVKEMGWPLRVYVNKPVDAQVFIDNIVVKESSSGKTLIKQNFAEAGIEGIVTWNGGNAVHIPVGYVPYQEGEVLGFNEIVNGDFESAYLMAYWWARKDWNGGMFAREEGMGYDGSAGLVARGTGAGTADQNAGCFYSLYGEGHEATLDISAGKTYVLTYKVFRPAGVDSYTYIDINEGSAVNGTATKNGEWETVTARFVAPKGALKIRLVVNALAEGEYVVFDDIELRQVGGDPNGNPKTDDNMMLGLVVAAMAVSAIGVVVVSKKRVLSK